ncbi:L-fucose:H+ symporter permease [Marinoscillum sp. MHG1-6]|uniref:L-fucose:H+ symporter permease n=1 Tax=Marinoscillum sp. MHG1-6 TaxID=2959627 RepID=UPI002157C5A9|nr:L-fucose:H+ symporter permease [Marinoscillum sp. MHG1-6]
MKEKDSTPVVSKEYLVPFILVTTLFALWGFANDITNPMVATFKTVMEISNTQASLVQFAFYGGYFTMAIPAALFIKKYTYKSGILMGLALYAVGALMFYPAASFEMFGLFLISLYILTFGLAFLETTANPFILALGDPKTATRRLNLAQAFNPIGALLGQFVAINFILVALRSSNGDFSALELAEKAVIRTHDLMLIRNPYVVLGLVVVGILVVFFVSRMPTKGDKVHDLNVGESFKRLFANSKYMFGVVAQMFYVGAQIMCWTYIVQYGESIGMTKAEAQSYNLVATSMFLASRWICTFLLKYISGPKLMMIFSFGAIIMMLGTIFIGGTAGLYTLIGASAFMSLMFPTIYGIALDGLGEDAKLGSAGLVMAIVGGAVMPVLQGAILDFGGPAYDDLLILGVPEVNFSFVLPLVCFIVIVFYSLFASRQSKGSLESTQS